MARPTLVVVCAAALLSLTSCSGAMDVTACIHQGRLAFKFGDVPGILFGEKTPAPRHITVTDLTIEGPFETRVMWDAEKHANVGPEPEERSLVLYGESLIGLTVNHRPKRLQIGRRYQVFASAGPDMGGDKFVFSNKLPFCSTIRTS